MQLVDVSSESPLGSAEAGIYSSASLGGSAFGEAATSAHPVTLPIRSGRRVQRPLILRLLVYMTANIPVMTMVMNTTAMTLVMGMITPLLLVMIFIQNKILSQNIELSPLFLKWQPFGRGSGRGEVNVLLKHNIPRYGRERGTHTLAGHWWCRKNFQEEEQGRGPFLEERGRGEMTGRRDTQGREDICTASHTLFTSVCKSEESIEIERERWSRKHVARRNLEKERSIGTEKKSWSGREGIWSPEGWDSKRRGVGKRENFQRWAQDYKAFSWERRVRNRPKRPRNWEESEEYEWAGRFSVKRPRSLISVCFFFYSAENHFGWKIEFFLLLLSEVPPENNLNSYRGREQRGGSQGRLLLEHARKKRHNY